MIDKKGNHFIEVDGEQIGFRFSTWAWLMTQKKLNCAGYMSTMERIGLNDGNLDIDAYSVLVMEARNDFIDEENTGEKKFDQRDACRFISKMGGIITSLAMFSDAIQGYQSKNQTPPQTVGEPELMSQ